MPQIRNVVDPSSSAGCSEVQALAIRSVLNDPRITAVFQDNHSALESLVKRLTRKSTSIESLAEVLLSNVINPGDLTVDKLIATIIRLVHNSHLMRPTEHYTPELKLRSDGTPRINKYNKQQVVLTNRAVTIVAGLVSNELNMLEEYLDVLSMVIQHIDSQRNLLATAYAELCHEAADRGIQLKRKNETLSAVSGLGVPRVVAKTRHTYRERYRSYNCGLDMQPAARQIGYLDQDQEIRPSVRKHELGSTHFQKVEAAAESHIEQALRFRVDELDAAGPEGSPQREATFKMIVDQTNKALIARGEGLTPGLSRDQQIQSMFAAPVPAAKRRAVAASG